MDFRVECGHNAIYMSFLIWVHNFEPILFLVNDKICNTEFNIYCKGSPWRTPTLKKRPIIEKKAETFVPAFSPDKSIPNYLFFEPAFFTGFFAVFLGTTFLAAALAGAFFGFIT